MALTPLLSGFGSLWRHGVEPPVHPAHILPPFYFDVPITETVVVCLILVLGMLLSLPGFNWKQRGIVGVYTSVLLFVTIGGVILVAQFSRGWSTSVVRTRTPFRAFDPTEIVADVGFHGGLRGFNVTVNGAQRGGFEAHLSDHTAYVRYEEEFAWSDPWTQGRLGFGPFAGRVNQDFRAGQTGGMPTPVLLTAEWWTLDGEQIRFGRYFRLAGLYTQYFLWVAFASWLCTAAVLFLGAARAASWGLVHTGAWMVGACVTYRELTHWTQIPFVIPFRDGHLEPTRLGWTFYWVLICGALSIGVGALYLAYEALRHRTNDGGVSGWLKQTLGVSQASLIAHSYERTNSVRRHEARAAARDAKLPRRPAADAAAPRRGGGPVVAPNMAVLMHFKYGAAGPATAGDDGAGGRPPQAADQAAREALMARWELRLLMRAAQLGLTAAALVLMLLDDDADVWIEREWRTLVLCVSGLAAGNALLDAALLLDSHYRCLRASDRVVCGVPLPLAKAVVTDLVFVCLSYAAAAATLGERYDDAPPPGPVSHKSLSLLVGVDVPDDTTINGSADAVLVLLFCACFSYLVSLYFSWGTAAATYRPDEASVLRAERDTALQTIAGELRARKDA